MAALGHRGRSRVRSFGSLTPSRLQHFFVLSHSLIFLCLLQPCAILRPICFLIDGRGRSVGRTDWAGGEMYCCRHMCYLSGFCLNASFFFSYYLIKSNPLFPPSFSLLFILSLLLLACFPCSNPSLVPSCSPFPLQGGRQFTAVGGRRACHVLLCLGLHQNIPSLVTLATGFPFLTKLL